jgi:hypothetical protein
MRRCWAQTPEDRPSFLALREFLQEVRRPEGGSLDQLRRASESRGLWTPCQIVTFFCPRFFEYIFKSQI